MRTLDDKDFRVLDDSEFKVEENPSILDNIKSNIVGAGKSAYDTAKSTAEDIAPYLESLGSSAVDTGLAGLKGLTINAPDEISAALQTGGEVMNEAMGSPFGESKQPGTILERYRRNQQLLQNELDAAKERSPYLSFGGELAGGLTSGSAITGALGIAGEAATGAPRLLDIARNQGKMKALGTLLQRGGTTYKETLPLMMTEGALSSEKGGLTSAAETEELGKDVLGSAMFGLPAVMGLQTIQDVAAPLGTEVGKKIAKGAEEYVKEKPLLRHMKGMFEYGERNINPKSEFAKKIIPGREGSGILAHEESGNVNELLNNMMEPRNIIGKDIENSLIKATKVDKTSIPFQGKTQSILDSVKNVAEIRPSIKDDSKLIGLLSKLEKTQELNPIETQELIDYTNAFMNKIKPATQNDMKASDIWDSLNTARKELGSTLKSSVPEYAKHSERYSKFMEIPEQLLAGNVPLENKNIFYSRINNADDNAYLKMKQMVQGLNRGGSGAGSTETAYNNLITKMMDFEKNELEQVASNKILKSSVTTSSENFANKLNNYSDKAAMRSSMDAVDPHTGVKGVAKQIAAGTGDTGRAIALSSANKAGMLKKSINASKNPVAKLSRDIFNAPTHMVEGLASTLSNTKGLEKYGENLSHALKSTNSNRRNQVLFTIMQNPSARAFVDQHANEEEQNNVPQE